MNTVIDTEGRTWKVGRVLTGLPAFRCQFEPGHGQINIGPLDSDGNNIGITLPKHMIEDWIAGRIRIRVTTRKGGA